MELSEIKQNCFEPHKSWAEYYDFVYERTYGNYYHSFTQLTLDKISEIIRQGSIIDYGAGTGRLSIPLMKNGYSVISVEKSKGMVNELANNFAEKFSSLAVAIYNCSISEYSSGKADLALALFTVLSYTITEDELSENINNICKHINPNGYFFFDLPNPNFFQNVQLIKIPPHGARALDFNRSVTLSPTLEHDLYIYREECSGIFNGEPFQYTDCFCLRYWPLETLDKLLRENGFADTNKTYPEFNNTGSTYKLYQKK